MSYFSKTDHIIDEDDIYIDCQIPENIYHYTSKDGLLGILKGDELQFSHLAFVNDKYEYLEIFQILGEMKSEIQKELKETLGFNNKDEDLEPIIKNMIGDIYSLKTFLKEKIGSMFIMSFCRNEDSLCMWANYTNKLGYNISVDSSKLVEVVKRAIGQKNIVFISGNVVYDDEDKKKIIIKIFKDFFKEFKLNPKRGSELRSQLLTLIVLHAPFFKRSILKQEEEIRFCLTVDNSILEDYIEFKQSNNVNVPYLKLQEKFSECYNGVRIGPLVKEFNSESLFLYLRYAKERQQDNELYYKIYCLKNINKESITKSEISYKW